MHFVKRFDRNKDGRLSTQEFDLFKAKLQEAKMEVVPAFKECDKDNNGYITLDEASNLLTQHPFNFPPGKVVMLLKLFDRDGNGKLDIEEFGAFYADVKATNEDVSAEFDRLDKDGNGVLSPEEVQEVIKNMMGFDNHTARQMVEIFDQNQDGSLDKQEFMNMWSSMFGNCSKSF